MSINHRPRSLDAAATAVIVGPSYAANYEYVIYIILYTSILSDRCHSPAPTGDDRGGGGESKPTEGNGE